MNAGGFVTIDCPSCDGSGVRVLPAICVLRDELEQVGRGVEYVDDMTGATLTTIGFDVRNYFGIEFPVFRLSDPIPSPQNAEASE